MSLWGPLYSKQHKNRARKHGFEMEDRYVDLAAVCTLPSGLTKHKSEGLSSHLTQSYGLFSVQPYSVIHDTITYMWHFNLFQTFILHQSSTHRNIFITDSSQTSFGKAFSLKMCPINSTISEGRMSVQTQKARKVLETYTLRSSLQDVLYFTNQKMI